MKTTTVNHSLSETTVPTAHELLQAIEDAGGELRISDPPKPVRVRLRKAIYALINGETLSEGYRLRHTGRDKGDLVISIVAIQEDPRPAPKSERVRVPESLRGCHPLIRATREAATADREGWIDTRSVPGIAHMRLTKGQLQRALLLLQGLVAEAEARGYRVRAKDAYRCKGGLHIEIDGRPYEICVKELSKRRNHEPTASESAAIRRSQYVYIPKWDFSPSGRLEFRDDHDHYGPPLASDRERWKLEDRLGRVFERLEEKAAMARARDEQRDLEARERERKWQAAMDEARVACAEQHRRQWLESQVRDRRIATEIRSFVSAVRSQRADVSDTDVEWLTWALDHADQLDSLSHPLAPPPPPEPSPDDLKPFLACGWSPYGPEPGRFR